MNLATCLSDVGAELPEQMAGIEISDLTTDSRLVKPGDLFVSLAGPHSGLAHLEQARQRGAAACLIEGDRLNQLGHLQALVGVDELQSKTSRIAGNFFGHPSTRLDLVGVTGTNGKTSLCRWLEFLLCRCGLRVASLGTLGVSLCGASLQAPDGMTTRDPVESQRWLAKCLERGAEICAMEVSSHGLDQDRVADLKFDIAVLTNFTRDHLDYHGSEEAYWQAKRRLFDMPGLRLAVINIDDEHGARLAQELAGKIDLTTFSSDGSREADLQVLHAGFSPLLAFEIRYRQQRLSFEAPGLIAGYELSNLCAALAVCLALQVDLDKLQSAVSELRGAPGRLQLIGTLGEGRLYVDYAHTPDAVANCLRALRPAAKSGLVAVVGCGGDRDKGKRPLMAAAAHMHSDCLILTSDNPRSEDPLQILEDMRAGISGQAGHFEIEPDRAEAIRRAVELMKQGYLVALLGKGHEDYQLVGDRKLPFSDAAVAAELIAAAGGEVL